LRLNTASTSWRLVRSIVAMLVFSAAPIRLSLQPSPSSDTSAFSRMRAFVKLGGTLAFADKLVPGSLTAANDPQITAASGYEATQ
jgi:hypothetical protein